MAMFVIQIIVLLAAWVLLLLIYKYDMYDREPWYLILLTIFLGGLSAYWVSDYEDWLILQMHATESKLRQALIASICEESCKVAIILMITFALRRWFNDPMDGIVYGAIAGLGFALEESRFYVELAFQGDLQPSRWQLFGQECVRLMLHFLTGGLAGFGIGLLWAKVHPPVISRSQAAFILIGSLSSAFTIHFLWDYACGIRADPESVSHRLAAVFLMVFALLLFGGAVSMGRLLSGLAHPPQGDVPPLLRWPFTLFVRAYKRRQ